ncbi:hypothetical protein FHP25_27840 [Vineibacter terrae]|uniref:Uncharacterized protein n=1 Tax=Vineibacter terrae TaxID=2586908 RepID=A0A5C8PE06_9HYPH|nr:hypothetical protein [Vineibacter terrae]TXL71858.1 hypothetical protein FHP25_27840 [Vineibacter terrae]
MQRIEAHRPAEAFHQCWQAAGEHIQRHAPASLAWLKARFEPPFLEHLSFRIGNQLFFVQIEDEHRELELPGNRKGLMRIAGACRGHPCVLPMRLSSDAWSPVHCGWGLRHAQTGEPVDPGALVTDERIEMTDWEVHDCAVEAVRERLEEQGREVTASAGDPDLNPAIWFKGDRGPEWVVVRAARHPAPDPEPPANWAQIAQSCAHLSKTGHFAAVRFASPDDPFDPEGHGAIPLWRGHAMIPNNFKLVQPGRPVGLLGRLMPGWRR